jgi:hypothetical protein
MRRDKSLARFEDDRSALTTVRHMITDLEASVPAPVVELPSIRAMTASWGSERQQEIADEMFDYVGSGLSSIVDDVRDWTGTMRPLIRSVRSAHNRVRPPPFPSRTTDVASPDMAWVTSEASETHWSQNALEVS